MTENEENGTNEKVSNPGPGHNIQRNRIRCLTQMELEDGSQLEKDFEKDIEERKPSEQEYIAYGVLDGGRPFLFAFG